MYDGDAPGVSAALKTIDLLLLEGMNVQLILFPDGDDPDSFCRKHSTEEIKRYFDENEKDFVAFKASVMLQGNVRRDPIKKAQITQNIVQSIALIENPIYSSAFIREASQLLDLDEMAIIKAIKTAKDQNYAAEVRKFEIEQRRKMAQQEREDREAEGLKAMEIKTEELTVNDENGSEETSASVEEQPTQQSSAVTPSPLTETRPTDRFERNIIRNIVRHGGKLFDYKFYDENGQMVCERWRVIDYIGCVLQQDEIEFNVPLYAKMLQLAYDASEDPNDEWDSVKFFTTHYDPEVSKLALSLESDRYDALGIAKNVEDLDILIPRCVLELQECIVRTEINDCNKALKYPSPDTDVVKIMQRLQELYNIKKVFDKELGERIVTL